MRLRSLLYTLPLACTLIAQAQTYSVIDKWTLGGEGGWDYLLADPSSHLLYVTHGTRVEVVDTKTGKPVGAITGLKGTHGVALDPDGKYGYISEGAGNNVVVFDRKTFATVKSIPAGTNPDGIVYEPVTKTVWAFNGRSMDATVIDTQSMTVTGTVKLSGKPEFPQADGKGTVFVNIETKNSIARIDAKSMKVTAEWPLAGCESPSGMAMDTASRKLFSVCDGKVMSVTDADSGKVLKLVPIGDGPDAAGYDAAHHLAFSSNGEGTLTVVDTATSDYKVIQTLPTQKSGRTMAFDSGNGHVYVVAAEMGPRPAATAENPRPRPAVVPGSFTVLVISRK
ncbi:YncE family protein [Granulicella arctica]|uniref:YncE family protein n=1 Tax=Granulicella arctica TaxID=940613 RepID=UPI0021E0BC3E|nr:YncE family protein [Granulicella arctica]